MSIKNNLELINSRLTEELVSIKSALILKGVDIQGDIKLSEIADYIGTITAGTDDSTSDSITVPDASSSSSSTSPGDPDAGGGDSSVTKVIIAKNGSYNHAITGTFVDNGNGRYVREGDSSDYYYYIEWYDGGWHMFDNQGNYPNGYANFGGTQGDISSIAGTQSPYWTHEASPYEVTITVTGGSSGGDTPSVTYTVSGSSNASANGDYYDTGVSFNNRPTYTNGSYYMFYTTYGMWYISDTNATNSAYPLHTFTSDAETAPIGEWSGNNGATVTERLN